MLNKKSQLVKVSFFWPALSAVEVCGPFDSFLAQDKLRDSNYDFKMNISTIFVSPCTIYSTKLDIKKAPLFS